MATYEKAIRWTEGRHQAVGRPDVGHTFDWKLIRDVAEEVARDRKVSIGAVHGTALVFAVEGDWWTRFDAGVVLCSDSIRSDRNAARVIVRTASSRACLPETTRWRCGTGATAGTRGSLARSCQVVRTATNGASAGRAPW